MNILKVGAFWIKGKKIIETTISRHISYIIKNPEKFGLTKKEINDIYKKHGEKEETEGKAREEIIKKASKSGWVRVRHYSKPDYWSIQTDRWLPSREKTISNFLYNAIYDKEYMQKDAHIVILGYEDGFRKEYKWKDGGAQKFLEEHVEHDEDIEFIEYVEPKMFGKVLQEVFSKV